MQIIYSIVRDSTMDQPSPEINELITRFIQSPQDPVLQEQIAVLKASGPAQSRYLESRLEAWLKDDAGAVITTGTLKKRAPSRGRNPFTHRFPAYSRWLWIAAAAVILVAGGITFYHLQAPPKMAVRNNTSDHLDSFLLADGSKVVLNKNAIISHGVRPENDHEIAVLAGDVYFDLKQQSACRVTADSQNILLATGAAFNVHKTKTTTGVFVARGKLTIVKEDGKETVLSTNMQGKLADAQPLKTQLLKSQAPLAWRTGALRFRNVPLEEVLDAVSGYYSIDIHVPPSAARKLYKKKLTVDFRTKSEKEMIAQLQKSLLVYIVKDSTNAYYVTLK
ncbi:FecR domain-containing protein [Chitinophaga sp. MM2321]|uniref:FecR family protein n=1 Tax=Chitinophaga sp. MM2321 TaxID=3137178 RepID=UPI0032D57612